MSAPSIAEFAQLRFVRDRDEQLVYLPAKGIDEKSILALDCRTFRLVRLHIFEGAALRSDKVEAFEEEMQQIADLKQSGVSRMISWGRDENELFFADEMLDGEPLPDYLKRTGGVSFPVAAEWILYLNEVLEACKILPFTLQRFSNRNIQVIVDRFGEIKPGFSEFYGWTKPGAQVSHHSREWMLAQVFCAAIVGVPARIFSRGSLPRNFEQLPASLQDAVLAALDEVETSSRDGFYRELKQLEKQKSDHGDGSPPERPVSAIRQWLADELEASYPHQPEYSLGGDVSSEDLRYSTETVFKGRPGLVQVVPGKESIPRIGWLNQHHDASRRPGRSLMHQLAVWMIEDRGAISLIGEERPDGISLEELVGYHGPLEIPHALVLSHRIASTIDALESNAASIPIWWLPPSGVFAVTGTSTGRGAVRLMRRKGKSLWKNIPLRLRLHQTTASLLDGVNLPESLLRLCNEPERKKYAGPRRSSVLLYLLWYLLTGKSLDWNEPVTAIENVSEHAARRMDTFRKQLIQSPASCTQSLLLELENIPHQDKPAVSAKKSRKQTRQTPKGKTTSKHSDDSDSQDAVGPSELREILGETLYEELIEIDETIKDTVIGEGPTAQEPDVDHKEEIPHEKDEQSKEPIAQETDHAETTPAQAELPDDEPSPEKSTTQAHEPPETAAPKKSKKFKLPFKIPTFAFDTVKVGRHPEAESVASEDAEADAAPEPDDKGSPNSSFWLGAVMLGLISAAVFGSTAHVRASRRGPFPADTADRLSFPVCDYVERLESINPFDPIDPMEPFGGTFAKQKRSSPPVLLDESDTAAALQSAAEAMKSKLYSDAVSFSLLALQSHSGDHSAARESLKTALEAWMKNCPLQGNELPSGPSLSFPLLAEYSLRRDRTEGLRKLAIAALKDQNPAAMRILGLLFWKGKQLPVDKKAGIKWLEKAAETGDQDARFLLAEGILSGDISELPKNDAIALLRESAAAGHSTSQELLGISLISGKGVRKNPSKGIQWLASSAEKGNPGAMFHLALCHASGRGVSQNPLAAARLFQKAAELGDVRSMHQYGRCLASGFGIQQSWPLACRWNRKAAMSHYLPAIIWCQKRNLDIES